MKKHEAQLAMTLLKDIGIQAHAVTVNFGSFQVAWLEDNYDQYFKFENTNVCEASSMPDIYARIDRWLKENEL